LLGIRARVFDIRAGNAAMYYPEANVLIPRVADPLSRTPVFKSVAVRVKKSAMSEPRPSSNGLAVPRATGRPRELKSC
jgi:hypothetical protein